MRSKDMYVDMFFYDPSEAFLDRVKKRLLTDGFEITEGDEKKWAYKNGEKLAWISDCEDCSGRYIIVSFRYIDYQLLYDELKICPECGSKKIKPSFFHPYRNAEIDRLFDEGKLDYGYGAYDRMGTRPPTRACLSCGHKWFNFADIIVWTDIYESGRDITAEDIGIWDE